MNKTQSGPNMLHLHLVVIPLRNIHKVVHWVINNQLVTFNCYFPGYCVHDVSAFDRSKPLHGRSNGGVLIIYHGTFGAKTKFIPTPSKR